MAIPDPVFTGAGTVFFLWILLKGAADYSDYSNMGPYYRFADGSVLHMPWIRVLSDWTGVLVVLGFVFRKRPVKRNSHMGDVSIGLIGSYWLFIPFVILAACDFADQLQGSHLAADFRRFWISDSLSMARTFIGAGLVTLGNAIDTWGYTILTRSFSLVPEARELRVTGPYRLIRHPVYFGQILAQAGIYLCFAGPHLTWVLFWLLFCGIQLIRSWREEKVLEEAFGLKYREWQRGTFWFWRGTPASA